MEITNDDINNEMVTHYVYELNNGKGGSYFGVTKNPKRRERRRLITEHIANNGTLLTRNVLVLKRKYITRTIRRRSKQDRENIGEIKITKLYK